MKNKIQKFKISHKKLPGFNDIISAASTFNNRRKSKQRTSYTRIKKEFTELVSSSAISSGIIPIKKLFLELEWIEPNKRRDPDNIAVFIKFILDGLQKAEIIENDGWKQINGWKNTFKLDKNNKTREVRITLIDLGDSDE